MLELSQENMLNWYAIVKKSTSGLFCTVTLSLFDTHAGMLIMHNAFNFPQRVTLAFDQNS